MAADANAGNTTALSFGMKGYCKEEESKLQEQLHKKFGPSFISQRPSATEGQRVAFVETWKLIALANELFGFNGWSNSITSQNIDFVDEVNGRYHVGVSACVRVTLKDGAYHEELGYGTAEGLPSKGTAIEKARKEAVADGLKRALRNFGNALGNCLGDKHFLQWVVNAASDTSQPAGSASVCTADSLAAQLITTAQMTVTTAAATTITTTAPVVTVNAPTSVSTIIDMHQQQQQLQPQIFQLQIPQAHQQQRPVPPQAHQVAASTLQAATMAATSPRIAPAFQQQLPLLHPFTLAGSAGITTSTAQQLFLVRPVGQAGMAGATLTALPATNFPQLQQQPPRPGPTLHSHGQLHVFDKIFNKPTSSQPPITLASNMHTVVSNNFPTTFNSKVQSGIMSNLRNGAQNRVLNNPSGLVNTVNALLTNTTSNKPNNGPNSIQNTRLSNILKSGQNGFPTSVPPSFLSNSFNSAVTTCAGAATNVHHGNSKKAAPHVKSSLGKTHKGSQRVVSSSHHSMRDILPRKDSVIQGFAMKDNNANFAAEMTVAGGNAPLTSEPFTRVIQHATVVAPPNDTCDVPSKQKVRKENHGKKRSRSRGRNFTLSSSQDKNSSVVKKNCLPFVTIHNPFHLASDCIDIKDEVIESDDDVIVNSGDSLSGDPLNLCQAIINNSCLTQVKESDASEDRAAGNSFSEQQEACLEERERKTVALAMTKLCEEVVKEPTIDFDEVTANLHQHLVKQASATSDKSLMGEIGKIKSHRNLVSETVNFDKSNLLLHCNKKFELNTTNCDKTDKHEECSVTPTKCKKLKLDSKKKDRASINQEKPNLTFSCTETSANNLNLSVQEQSLDVPKCIPHDNIPNVVADNSTLSHRNRSNSFDNTTASNLAVRDTSTSDSSLVTECLEKKLVQDVMEKNSVALTNTVGESSVLERNVTRSLIKNTVTCEVMEGVVDNQNVLEEQIKSNNVESNTNKIEGGEIEKSNLCTALLVESKSLCDSKKSSAGNHSLEGTEDSNSMCKEDDAINRSDLLGSTSKGIKEIVASIIETNSENSSVEDDLKQGDSTINEGCLRRLNSSPSDAEDENSFVGFTEDMYMKSPQSLADRECEKRKKHLESQRAFRQNMKIRFRYMNVNKSDERRELSTSMDRITNGLVSDDAAQEGSILRRLARRSPLTPPLDLHAPSTASAVTSSAASRAVTDDAEQRRTVMPLTSDLHGVNSLHVDNFNHVFKSAEIQTVSSCTNDAMLHVEDCSDGDESKETIGQAVARSNSTALSTQKLVRFPLPLSPASSGHSSGLSPSSRQTVTAAGVAVDSSQRCLGLVGDDVCSFADTLLTTFDSADSEAESDVCNTSNDSSAHIFTNSVVDIAMVAPEAKVCMHPISDPASVKSFPGDNFNTSATFVQPTRKCLDLLNKASIEEGSRQGVIKPVESEDILSTVETNVISKY